MKICEKNINFKLNTPYIVSLNLTNFISMIKR